MVPAMPRATALLSFFICFSPFHVIAYFLSLNREGIRVLTVRLYRLESMSLTLDCTNRQTGDKVFLEEGIRTGDGYNNDDRDSHTNSLRRH